MPIAFKSKLSSTIANATWLDKTIDDATVGKLDLLEAGSADIIDIQAFINQMRTDINLNDAEIADHEIRIGDNETQLVDHETRIGDNETNIATNVQGIIDARSIWEQEIPTGVVDAVNDEFVLSETPQSDKAVMLYLNGLIQFQTVHYTILASTITMITPPAIGQDLYAVYDRGL